MKNYDDLTNRLLERRNRCVAEPTKKKQIIARATVSVGSVALVSLAGFALWGNDAFHDTPPVTDGGVTTTTATTGAETTTASTAPTEQDVTTTTTATVDTTATTQTTATTSDSGIVTPTNPTTTDAAPSQTTPSKTQPTATTPSKTEPSKTNPTQPTVSQTRPTATQTQPTQTTPTTQPTVTVPSNDDPVEPMPEWPYLWIIYESGENYVNGEVPIYFKLEGFEEVPFDWVKETSYTADGFSVVGDITVERDAETGAIIYRMVLAYDGVTPKPSFFFSVVTADGMKQTDGLYGYPAAHGFFVSPSYDSAFSSSVYYLVKTGVITHDEYQAIMEKYWSQFGFEFSIVVDDNLH